MIKGKYIGKIEIDIGIDEKAEQLVSFDEVEEAVKNEMSIALKTLIVNELGILGNVEVEQQYADVWLE